MKKSIYAAISAFLIVAVVVAIGAFVLFFGKSPNDTPDDQTQKHSLVGEQITIYDAQGNVLISTNTSTDIYGVECWQYLEFVLSDMAEIIALKEDCSLEEAQDKLFDRGYQIYTAFDSTVFDALKTIGARWGKHCNTAAAITDLQGRLLAVRCTDTEGRQANYALERRSPYSSFKTLSVYAQAVEKGIANWSTLYKDSPYKQMKDEDGTLRDWPANSTNRYSQENMTVYDALRTSTNTVAVKCLADVGIKNSIEFLQTKFGIPLKEESYVVKKYGAEEVLGNIALGYLETGVTTVEMAGYYQIFATGGKYAEPNTIDKVSVEDNPSWYTRKEFTRQVISPGTADIMNKLLQGVVAPGGTGEMAFCEDVEIAGKTGTGDNNADNWFVGVTPGYSLAVWHGQNTNNQAEEMFATVIKKLYSGLPNAKRKFITHVNLQQIAYCAHSGKAFSENCAMIDSGYYASDATLPVCDTCKKP